jgi:nicotinamide-nucleotide amidase
MKKLLEKIHNSLIAGQLTIAVAESCTGGQLCASLTSLPGSSKYFILGVVTYSNRAKSHLLSIPQRLLHKHGAVSDIVCRKMASSVKKLAGTDFGIGITGIAGPSGATPGKPVGTVYIAVSTAKHTRCRNFLFKGNRHTIKSQSCQAAATMLMHELK